MRLKSKTQKGSVLLAVVVVSMMMMVIVAAGISMVGHTQTRTNREYREKQAYFLASSSLKGFVSEVTKFGEGGCTEAEALANVTQVQNMIDKTCNVDIVYKDGSTSIPLKDVSMNGYDKRLNYGFKDDNTCKCTIKVEQDGSKNALKAIATADYLGETATVVAYFTVATPAASGALNNALEFIGTTGGSPTSYNNVKVFGNTGSTSTQSHADNIMYKFFSNDARMEGTTDILGSILYATQGQILSNFNYKPGVDPVEDAGCVLEVSRSAIFIENQGRAVSAATKKRDFDGKPTYNYINTGEALICAGNYSADAPFCGKENFEVDIYTCGLVTGGKLATNTAYQDSRTKAAFENSWSYSESNPAGLTNTFKNFDGSDRNMYDLGNPNQFSMYGNLYTYQSGDFKGDISFAGNDANIYGDIYCSGNIYMYATRLNMYSDSKIHMMSEGKVFVGSTSNVIDKDSASKVIQGHEIVFDDWREKGIGGDRAARPTPKTKQAQEYLHEPESFFMVNMDTDLDDEYQSMYKSSTPGTAGAMQLRDPGSDRSIGQIPYLSLDTIDLSAGKDGTASLRNTGLKKIKDSNGNEYCPRFWITESFVLGNYNYNNDTTYGTEAYRDATKGQKNNIIYIDVEAAGHDICVLMKDGATFTANQETKIVVHNKPDPDHYVYFCTDSGCGTVTTTNPSGEPAANYKTIVGTDFRSNPTFTFYPEGTNYIVTDKLWDALVTGKTASYVPDDSAIYMFAGANSSVTMSNHNNLLFEGSIYAPKADITYILGVKLNIDYFSTDAQNYCVLGALMCRNWTGDPNCNTIAYEQAAPNSLLPKIVKSVAVYDAGFKLNYYKAT